MEKILTLTIFSKQRTSKDGKKFMTYFTKMPNEDTSIKVKFRQVCGAPECPANIDLRQKGCNMSTEPYTDSVTGESKESRVLWISEWEMSPNEYHDSSMDDYF